MKKQITLIFTIVFYSNLVFSQTNSWFTWGNNSFGVFGNGTSGSNSSFFEPTQIANLDSFREIYTGDNHVYALDKNNVLWAWGQNSRKGQLGIDSDKFLFDSPQKVETTNIWKKIAVQNEFSAGIDTIGTLWVWGKYPAYPENYGGSTGSIEISPVQIDTTRNWIDVKVGSTHILLLRNDNTLWSLGLNTEGALGIAGNGGFNPTKIMTPQLVMQNVAYYETHGSSSFAIDKYGYLFVWGFAMGLKITDGSKNYYSDSIYYTIPHLVTSDSNWKEVKIKGAHAVAMKKDGTIWSWGRNEFGQLGIGNYSNADIPTKIGMDSNWRSISASNSNCFGIKDDGTLWSWGRGGEFSGLGFGSKDQNVPQQIKTDTSWNTVQSGSFYSFARRKDVNFTSIKKPLNEHISFGPNPTEDYITFSQGTNVCSSPCVIKIYDHVGRLLELEVIVDIKNYSYPIKDNLGAGLFIVSILQNNNVILNKKIIVN